MCKWESWQIIVIYGVWRLNENGLWCSRMVTRRREVRLMLEEEDGKMNVLDNKETWSLLLLFSFCHSHNSYMRELKKEKYLDHGATTSFYIVGLVSFLRMRETRGLGGRRQCVMSWFLSNPLTIGYIVRNVGYKLI